MKDKLLQLEQEMQELKGQISAVEQAQKAQAAAAVSPVTPPPSAPPATPAPSGPQAVAEKPPKETGVGKTSLDVYGYAMMDMGYDFKTNDPNWFDVVRPTKLPSFNGEFAPNGKVYFGVRQTRFGVTSSTPTRFGDLKTQFEFELFGTGVDAGQTTFRLRHAYGELGQFGAGQTWSPFMDIDVFPNSIEYWGPTGMVFFRNVQFRWMPVRSDRSRVIVALERPGASADQGIYSDRIELQGVKPKFNAPDVSGQLRIMRGWGYLQLAGIFRKISWVDTNNDPFNLSDTVYGWGVNVTSNVKFGSNDVGKFAVVYGHGIQNYMNDAPVDVAIKNNFQNPITPIKGVPLPVLGVVSFLDHNWSKYFTSSIGYSMINIDNSNAEDANDFHQGHYALTNLLYHPVPTVTIGSEFQFGRRLNFSDGFNVNDYRLQFSFKYDWRKGLEF
jgi:outer membrane DcaP-like protein